MPLALRTCFPPMPESLSVFVLKQQNKWHDPVPISWAKCPCGVGQSYQHKDTNPLRLQCFRGSWRESGRMFGPPSSAFADGKPDRSSLPGGRCWRALIWTLQALRRTRNDMPDAFDG